jgi:hypothetical protein
MNKIIKSLVALTAFLIASAAWAGTASVSDGYKYAGDGVEVDPSWPSITYCTVTIYQNNQVVAMADGGGITYTASGVTGEVTATGNIFIYNLPDGGNVTVEVSVGGGSFYTSSNYIHWDDGYDSGDFWVLLSGHLFPFLEPR